MSKSAVEFIAPTKALIQELTANMRPGDIEEVWLSDRFTPEQAVSASLRYSDKTLLAVAGGTPLMLFGVARSCLLSEVGVPWGLGSTALDGYQRELAALSRPVIQMMRQGCTRLENFVHAGNIASVRWLRSCRFDVEPAAPFGWSGALFHRFSMAGVP
jgi:hypothetical protein